MDRTDKSRTPDRSLRREELRDEIGRAVRVGGEPAGYRQEPNREPERVGVPARMLDGFQKCRLAKQHFGIVAGARAAIFVDSFLDQKGRILVDEVGQLASFDDRRRPAEQIE